MVWPPAVISIRFSGRTINNLKLQAAANAHAIDAFRASLNRQSTVHPVILGCRVLVFVRMLFNALALMRIILNYTGIASDLHLQILDGSYWRRT